MRSMKHRDLSGLWYVLIVAGCFLTGGILGCLVGTYAGDGGGGELEQYLREFIALADASEVSWSIPAVVWNRGRWLVCCALFGMSAVGMGILPLLFGMRGFLLTFGISCFLQVFGGLGFLPAILLYGVPAILWAPSFLMLGIFFLRRSLSLFRKTAEVAPAEGRGEIDRGLLAAGVLFAGCVAFECGLLPRLLTAAAHILQK